MVYFLSGVAETNRAPFDVAEGESEIVAGFHVEYSGMAFRDILLGGIRRHDLDFDVGRSACSWEAGCRHSKGRGLEPAVCVGAGADMATIDEDLFLSLFLYLWFRATFPRYRYDQIMRLGWKVFIPVTLVWLVVVSTMQVMDIGPWFTEASDLAETMMVEPAADGEQVQVDSL